MFYFIKAKEGNTKGFYTGSTVSANKADAQQYADILTVQAAYRALQLAGRTIIPLTIGHAL
jgi:hypothetical protein